MEMYINDLSFQGQCGNYDQVIEVVVQLADTIRSSETMRGNTPVGRTRELKNALVCQDKTISDFLGWLFKKSQKSSVYKDILTKVLTNLIKGPFIDLSRLDNSIENVVDPNKTVIKDTSVHAALSFECNSIPAVISAVGSKGYDKPSFILDNDCRKVINLFSTHCHLPYVRTYEANPKHEIKAPKVVKGNLHSKMDLTADNAQNVLENGVYVEDKEIVFSYHNKRWYQFPAHLSCKYHGYPIGNPTNDPNVNRIIKIIGAPPYPDNGYKII
jgi:hypothetical protein